MTTEPFSSFKFIGSGDDYFSMAIAEIEIAKFNITMESYIFECDDIGKRVLKALANASKRNVTVRLMVDGIGSHSQILELRTYCQAHQIQFRVFRALPRILIGYARLTQFIRTANRRNHRKLLIVDKQTAFVGSFNISKLHSQTSSGNLAWKDLAAKVEGPEVIKIWELANAYWNKFRLSLRGRIPKINFTRVRSTHSMAARRSSRNLLIEKIRNSKIQIKILTPYFVPSKKLLKALKTATKTHTNIEIIIPWRSDFIIVDMAARFIIRTLLTRKIKVYRYLPSFLHAKSTTIDDWATMGSHNLNHRSLVHDLELDITLENPEELKALEKYWQKIYSESRLVTQEELNNDSFFFRLLCRFAYWFKNWL